MRNILDRSFTIMARACLCLMALTLLGFLLPIIYNGLGAVFFNATVEHEKFLRENLDYDIPQKKIELIERADAARAPLWKMISSYENSHGAAESGKLLAQIRKDVFASMRADKETLEKILGLGGRERAEKLRKYAESAWKIYDLEASRLAKSEISPFALDKAFKSEQTSLESDAKKFASDCDKTMKLGFSKRNSLRRNICLPPLGLMKKLRAEISLQNAAYFELKNGIRELLGPSDKTEKSKLNLLRQRYGQTRMDMAKKTLEESILHINIKTKNSRGAEISRRVASKQYFKNSAVEDMIDYIENNFDSMLKPHFTAYWGFFFDEPFDSNIFGGIWPMICGTFYLTFGSMLIAAPLGIAAAIYFSEYAKEGRVISLLRMCVGTLAGVPSIVFGLFGLAFLINTLKVSESKSVLAGAITLALLILPTIIRACEEALKAVPQSYREAALGLGAGKWKAICTVILPAALPSMLTGIIISMGRAAGETAPIIFTAATSIGSALAISDIFTQPTPALPWNIYNICSEHEMADRVGHVQYGMVLTLIGLVLALNFAAIWMRARLQNKVK